MGGPYYTIPHVVEALREGLLTKEEAIAAVKAVIDYREESK